MTRSKARTADLQARVCSPSRVALAALLLMPAGSGCSSSPGSGGPMVGAPPAESNAGPGAGTGGAALGPSNQGGGAVMQPGMGPAATGSAGATTPAGGGSAPGVGTATAGSSGGGEGQSPNGALSQWTMIGYDASSSYNNTAERVLTKQNAASLTIAWQVNLGTNVYGAPLQVGDTIYASSGAGIKALDASGKELWNNPTGTTGSMAYDQGTLYLYTQLGAVVALDATTGMQKWSQPPDTQAGDGSSSPVIAGDFVLIGGSSGGAEVSGLSTFRGFLAKLDKRSGKVAWVGYTVPSGSTGASLWSSAAADVADGMAFGTTGNNHTMPATDSSDAFVAFDFATGDIQWKNQRTMGDTWNSTDFNSPDADFGANPVLYEAMVDGVMTKLVSSGQKTGEAHAVDRATGKLIWTRKLCEGNNTRDGQVGIFVNGAWSGKYMLFACNANGASTMFGLDGATGDIGWMTPLPGPVYGRTSVANGVGFVGSGANLVVFDTDIGAILKTLPSNGGTVAGTVTIANGRVAFGEGLTWATGVAGNTLTVLKVQ